MSTPQDIRDVFARINQDREESNRKWEKIHDESDHKWEKIQIDITDIKNVLASMPGNISKMIHECQRYQDGRRRWSIGTIISFVSISIAAGALVISIKGCV